VIKDGAVVYEVRYPHSPQRVWRALVEPLEQADWLMPSVGFAAILGNKFTMACDPVGEIAGEVLEVDPPRLLTMSWTAPFGTTIVSVTLAPAADGTALTLVHSGWAPAASAARDQFESGWRDKLGSGLATVLDREA